MISEFDLLSDKISKLVQLAQSLRQQNLELRQQVESQRADMRQQIESQRADMQQQIDSQRADMQQQIEAQRAGLNQQIEALSADKASLAARMSEAHYRMAAVLERLPAPEPEVEQPEEPHDEEVA